MSMLLFLTHAHELLARAVLRAARARASSVVLEGSVRRRPSQMASLALLRYGSHRARRTPQRSRGRAQATDKARRRARSSRNSAEEGKGEAVQSELQLKRLLPLPAPATAPRTPPSSLPVPRRATTSAQSRRRAASSPRRRPGGREAQSRAGARGPWRSRALRARASRPCR